MQAVAAFDLATQTGYAVWEAEADSIMVGSFRMPKTGPDYGRFLRDFHDRALRVITPLVMEYGPEAVTVVYEMPVLPRNTHMTTLRKLYSLGAHLEYVCHGKVRCWEANVSDVRAHFIGKYKRADDLKALTVAACEARGWTPANSDEADALATLDYALHCLRLPGAHPGALFTETAA